MEHDIIEIRNLTKEYGHKKGVFNVNLNVKKGDIYGFVGPNGAGKTTTIRHIMGFIKPQSGDIKVFGKDAFYERESIQKYVGYLPGELSCIDEMTGYDFLKFIQKMKGVKDDTKIKYLIDYLELDSKMKIKKMSKGNKQKIGIVCAFMNNPKLLILDEPTSGLDPIMQAKFIDLIVAEKNRGTTVFLSSHIFDEVEKTCDKVAFINYGKIIAIEDILSLREKKNRRYCIKFKDSDNKNKYVVNHSEAKSEKDYVYVSVKGNTSNFIKDLSNYDVDDLYTQEQSLEEMFLHLYGGGDNE